ncbi:stalk domain-containing protein [Gorillibacterium massiliense]|uniref:stalk domain-containing protein n=1 Tax=Gorillibacterium massiliense TaxID=1280390 RepID=UPI0004B95BDD|nr:stalk domain-containing protein [Gorillibacterium massiliense]
MTSKQTKQPQASRSTAAKWVAIPLSAALLFGAGVSVPALGGTAHAEASADQNGLKISTLSLLLDGTEVTVPGVITDSGTSYVGIAAIGEKLGLKAIWDAATNTVTVTGPRTNVVINPNEDARFPYTVNGQKLYEAPSYIIKGRTYVPLKFILEQFGYNVTYNPKAQKISVDKVNVNDLTMGTKSLDASTNTYTLLAQYPSISGMADAQVQDKLNDFFKTDAENAFADAKKELSSTEGGNPDAKYEFFYDYKVPYNQDGKLSVILENYMYTGGAHGNTGRKAHTFDLATGKELTLKEAAGDNPKFKEIINAEVAKVFQAPDYPLLTPFTSISDNPDFFLRGNDLVVFFQQYEYTPYAYGFPEVVIPLSKFK